MLIQADANVILLRIKQTVRLYDSLSVISYIFINNSGDIERYAYSCSVRDELSSNLSEFIEPVNLCKNGVVVASR